MQSFNSRAPRGARPGSAPGKAASKRFNSRAPRGARRSANMAKLKREKVSTHAPHAGRASLPGADTDLLLCFNSRAPRGARPSRAVRSTGTASFNSRAPRGARRSGRDHRNKVVRFQLTRPTRGAPFGIKAYPKWKGVSTHAPHAGRAAQTKTPTIEEVSFNSRAPRGARHKSTLDGVYTGAFQLTRPTRGAPELALRSWRVIRSFNSRAPRGARRRSGR